LLPHRFQNFGVTSNRTNREKLQLLHLKVKQEKENIKPFSFSDEEVEQSILAKC